MEQAWLTSRVRRMGFNLSKSDPSWTIPQINKTYVCFLPVLKHLAFLPVKMNGW